MLNCKDIYKFYKAGGGILAYNVFKAIIAENSKAIANLIINDGYWFRIPYDGSIIRIYKNQRRIKIKEINGTIIGAINWGESNKLKQRLLDEGKTLYECVKDDEGKIVSDNGGEKWLVYFVDDYYYCWKKISDVLNKYSSNYDFEPTWTNSRALISSITEDSDLLYKQAVNGTNKHDFLKTINSTGQHHVRAVNE